MRARPKSATFTSPLMAEHDVLGLDVAVDDARFGGLAQGGDDLAEHVEHDARVEGRLALEHLAQVLAARRIPGR